MEVKSHGWSDTCFFLKSTLRKYLWPHCIIILFIGVCSIICQIASRLALGHFTIEIFVKSSKFFPKDGEWNRNYISTISFFVNCWPLVIIIKSKQTKIVVPHYFGKGWSIFKSWFISWLLLTQQLRAEGNCTCCLFLEAKYSWGQKSSKFLRSLSVTGGTFLQSTSG